MKNKQAESDRFVQALESDNADALSFEEQQINKLGHDLRSLADGELPQSNEVLREKLAMKLGEQELGTVTVGPQPSKSQNAISHLGRRLAIAACLALTMSVAAMMIPRVQQVREAARVSGGKFESKKQSTVSTTSWELGSTSKISEDDLSGDDEVTITGSLHSLDRRNENLDVDSLAQGDSLALANSAADSAGQQSGDQQSNSLYGYDVGSDGPGKDGKQQQGQQQYGQQQDVNGLSLAAAPSQSESGPVKDMPYYASPNPTPAPGQRSTRFVETRGSSSSMTAKSELKLPRQQQANQSGQIQPLRDRFQRDAGPSYMSDIANNDAWKSVFDGENLARGVKGIGLKDLKTQASSVNKKSGKEFSSRVAVPGTMVPALVGGGRGGGIGGGGGGVGGLGGGGRGKMTMFNGQLGVDESGKRFERNEGRDLGKNDLPYRRHNHDPRFFYESVSGEQYEPITENEFKKATGNAALSTFSIDVDTASYSNMRRFLQSGQRPPANAVRIEELVNYFDYDYPQPEGDRPFAVDMEIASCPWDEQHHLLRVALKGKEIHRSERSATNLVFLLDVSGSMQDQNKLPLLKQGLTMMVQQLNENDSVSIVTYAGNAGVVLNPTSGDNKRQIEKAIETLNAGGSTNGSAGIELAYELAQKQFINGGSNRVLLATDGDLNVGVTDDGALVELIKRKASEGVFLTVLGFGTGNLKDGKLEQLADNGNGMYAYIDNFREAHKVLIEQMSGSLETIAKDVKIQIEFNPSEVKSYRLIGYENRVLAAKDFDNDKKDAGEIGAGHSVTALYELQLSGAVDQTASAQNLKYQQTDAVEQPKPADGKTSQDNHSGELLTLALRFKKPDAQKSERIEFTLKDEPTSFSTASSEFRFAAAVASFGMILRGSQHQGQTSMKWVEETATRAIGSDVGGYRAEFIDLVRRAGGAR